MSTVSADGVTNAAPYSFFNVFSHHPALVVLGIERRGATVQKDTGRNIELGNEFVVNLVNEEIVAGMNDCAIDFPPEISEIELAGFTLAPSTKVTPPRIAEAPAALECRRFVTLQPGHGRELVIGEILAIHIRDGIVDPTTVSYTHLCQGLLPRSARPAGG